MEVITNNEEKILTKFIYSFYRYFENPFIFEEFIKKYLLVLGLDEIEITKKTRDGGIDIIAKRQGIGQFSDADTVRYYVQVKKYNPNNKIGVKPIRELKGIIPFGHKGVFITTSDFTITAKTEANNDLSKPIVLINRKNLITSCIDNNIGFVFEPQFSEIRLNEFMDSKDKSLTELDINANTEPKVDILYVEKMVTENDVRARIVSIPSSIFNKIPNVINAMEVKVNNEKIYVFTVNRKRKYFGGVTAFFKSYGFLNEDGVITKKIVRWHYNQVEESLIKLFVD